MNKENEFELYSLYCDFIRRKMIDELQLKITNIFDIEFDIVEHDTLTNELIYNCSIQTKTILYKTKISYKIWKNIYLKTRDKKINI